MCIRDSITFDDPAKKEDDYVDEQVLHMRKLLKTSLEDLDPVSYTHLRAHETVLDLVCRLLLETKKQKNKKAGIAASTNKIVYKS